MRLLAADVGARPIITASATIRPLVMARFAAHAALVDDQAAEHEPRLVQRAGRQHEALGHRDPLDMPRAGRALEVLDHRVEHQAGMLAHRLGGGEHQLARDRIALLRHGADWRRGP